MFRNPFRKKDDAMEDWLVSPRGVIRRRFVPPDQAFRAWQQFKVEYTKTGLWPIIVPADAVERLTEAFQDQGESVEDVLEMAANIDPQNFFSGRLQVRLDEEDEYPEEDAEYRTDLDFDPAGLIRELKPGVGKQIAALNDIKDSGGGPDPVSIALVPCRNPWEVPAVLGYGGWNDCPMPAEHTVALREWYGRHNAVPLVVGTDTLELFVGPIEDSAKARRVAIEQFAYCADIVDQGTETVEALAATLLGASVWFFWWD